MARVAGAEAVDINEFQQHAHQTRARLRCVERRRQCVTDVSPAVHQTAPPARPATPPATCGRKTYSAPTAGAGAGDDASDLLMQKTLMLKLHRRQTHCRTLTIADAVFALSNEHHSNVDSAPLTLVSGCSPVFGKPSDTPTDS